MRQRKKYNLMSKTVSISPFVLTPKIIRKHKKCSSAISENPPNNILKMEHLYDNFVPNKEEINQLKNEFNQYIHDYGLLISELNFWKKNLDKKFGTFLKNIQELIGNDDIKFVNNFNSECACFNDF